MQQVFCIICVVWFVCDPLVHQHKHSHVWLHKHNDQWSKYSCKMPGLDVTWSHPLNRTYTYTSTNRYMFTRGIEMILLVAFITGSLYWWDLLTICIMKRHECIWMRPSVHSRKSGRLGETSQPLSAKVQVNSVWRKFWCKGDWLLHFHIVAHSMCSTSSP